MFSGTTANILFNFYSWPGNINPFEILGKSTQWVSGSFANPEWESATGSFVGVGTVANIKLEGHFWDITSIGVSGTANIEALPILSGGSTGRDTIWDTYNDGENAPIGYVGQTMKNAIHLFASYACTVGSGKVQLDMSFDHIFFATWHPGD